MTLTQIAILVVVGLVIAVVIYFRTSNGASDEPEVRPIIHRHDCIHCSLMFSCSDSQCYGQRYAPCQRCGQRLNHADFSRGRR